MSDEDKTKVLPVEVDQDTSDEADAYYGEDDVTSDDFDLSFLDDKEE